MKVISKSSLINKKYIRNTKNERNILEVVKSEFVVKLHFSF